MSQMSEPEEDCEIILFDDDPYVFLRLMTPPITPGENDEFLDDYILLSETLTEEGLEAYADACSDTFSGSDVDEMIQYGVENLEIAEVEDRYTGEVFLNPKYE